MPYLDSRRTNSRANCIKLLAHQLWKTVDRIITDLQNLQNFKRHCSQLF